MSGAAPMQNQNFSQPNPNYGSGEGVGYNPGQIGYIPADIAKMRFQLAQFRATGEPEKQAKVFAQFPIMWATLASPILFFFAYGVLLMAGPLSQLGFSDGYGLMGTIVGGIVFVLVWAAAIGFAYFISVHVWVMAIAHHMQLKQAKQAARQEAQTQQPTSYQPPQYRGGTPPADQTWADVSKFLNGR